MTFVNETLLQLDMEAKRDGVDNGPTLGCPLTAGTVR